MIIIGAGGHCRSVIDAARESGLDIIGIIDIRYKNQKENILNCPVIGDFGRITEFAPAEVSAVIAIGDCFERETYYKRIRAQNFNVARIIHPSAVMSKETTVGDGVFISAGVIVNCGTRIGDNSIVNTGAIIEHEVTIGRHSHVGPGVKIGGRSTIGSCTFVGIGSTVLNNLTIGDRVVIGGGTVVISDIGSNGKIAGVPGKPLL